MKKGRLQLQQNDLAFEAALAPWAQKGTAPLLQVMAQSMTNFIESSGQLSHWRKWWPLYSSATLGSSDSIDADTPGLRHRWSCLLCSQISDVPPPIPRLLMLHAGSRYIATLLEDAPVEPIGATCVGKAS